LRFPVAVDLGALRVPAHVVFEVLAYVAACRLYVLLRRRWGDPIPTATRWTVIAGAAVGAAIGSKLVAWIERPHELVAHWFDPAWLMGGKSIVGGLLGGLAGVELAKKIARETRSTGDLFVLPLCLGIAIGRIGCFLAGLADQTYGVATSLPWAVDFGDGVARHPTQIYEVLALGIIAWWAVARRNAMAESGDLFRGFMVLYLAFRLAIEAIKPGDRAYAGLTGIQVACVVGLLYYVRDFRRVFLSPRPVPDG
jgi:prolipoprotein diacylglyceryltransferase